MTRLLVPTVLALCLSLAAIAQDEEPVAAPEGGPCASAEHRQFDFWIGDWDVSQNGEPAGVNAIHAVHGGCALQENWQGAGEGGISGSSYNIYDRATGKWHQSWVDSSGTLLLLDGGMVDGSMVLQGRRPTRDGSGQASHRITWTPNPDGSVRQLWEASKDGGANWSTLFDGLYVRQSESR